MPQDTAAAHPLQPKQPMTQDLLGHVSSPITSPMGFSIKEDKEARSEIEHPRLVMFPAQIDHHRGPRHVCRLTHVLGSMLHVLSLATRATPPACDCTHGTILVSIGSLTGVFLTRGGCTKDLQHSCRLIALSILNVNLFNRDQFCSPM